MAALNRNLGNFTKPFHAATRPRLNLTLKSLCTKASTQHSELQSLVDNFKNSCQNQRFRYLKHVYASHVRRLANAKQFDMIEDVLEHQKRFPDIQQEGFAVRLISLYGDSGMFEHARKLFDQLPELGCPRTVKSFNALLNSAIAAKEFHRVFELFNDLPSEVSVEPNVISHTTVIRALCELDRIDEALSKLREMGEKADIFTYNTLLSALYKSSRSSDAESLWAEIEKSMTEVKPDATSYHIRIKAMFLEKKVEEAVLLATEMKNKGITYDKYTYNNMIIGLCGSGNGNLKEAMKWYNDLHERERLRPLASTTLVLIPACCEAGDFDMASKICLHAARHKISLNSTMVKQVINGLAEKGETAKAFELMDLLKCLEE